MTSNPSSTSRRFRAPWIIFWVGLGLRWACIVIGHTYRIRVPMDHFGFGWEMGRIARSLALGEGFANPFNGYSGPSAWVPPLYPLLMAGSFKIFGIYTNAAACFLLFCNSVFSAGIAPAVYEIAARCFDAGGIARRASKYAEPVALWSAWGWAVYPAFLQYAIHWLWEMSLSTFLFTWTLALALRLRNVGEPASENPVQWQTGTWAVFGVLWGLLALSNASLLICLPAVILWVLWPEIRMPKTLPRPLAGAALACVLIGLVMAPWVIRNEITLHAFIPTRSNLGVELHASMLPSHDVFPWGTALPLWTGDPEFKLFVKMGEVKFSQMRNEQAKAMIRAHPGVLVSRMWDRFLFFWDGTPHPPDRHPVSEFFRELSYSFLSLCGLMGLGLALKRRVPAAWLMAMMFLLVPIPYYVITPGPRFRHPLEPLIAILGVYLFRSTEARKAAL